MELQVVFGTGPVGIQTGAALLRRGLRVRFVNRKGSIGADAASAAAELDSPGWDIVAADAMDAQQARAAAEGASHIFHCINPLYHQWAEVLPRVQENLTDAALSTGAVLTVSDNLYQFKRGEMPITSATTIQPTTRKGRIRKLLHEELRASSARGLAWTAVRASDYYGPGSTGQSVFGTDYFLDPLFKGTAPTIIGRLDRPHTFTYVKDFGSALALAAHDTRAHGRSWIVANDTTTTTGEVAALFMDAAGLHRTLGTVPRPLLRLLGLVNPVIREVDEMVYQKTEDYVVDGSEFNRTFGFTPTPLAQGVRETLDWYRHRHS